MKIKLIYYKNQLNFLLIKIKNFVLKNIEDLIELTIPLNQKLKISNDNIEDIFKNKEIDVKLCIEETYVRYFN